LQDLWKQWPILRQIKINSDFSGSFRDLESLWRTPMSRNIGIIDQYVRIVLGLVLIAFAFQDGPLIQGWHWVGLAGLVLLITAFFRVCPAYRVTGFSTLERDADRA
jgi:hypothetical protein